MPIDFITSPTFIYCVISFIAGYLTHDFLDGGLNMDIKASARVVFLLFWSALFAGAIIQSQFFGGDQVNLFLGVIGSYCTGSLIQEKEFFVEILKAIISKKK